jgi:glycogen debranching enzyme
VARATLRALAALQGRVEDPETDEEPGKILHEYRPVAEARFTEMRWPVRDGRLLYYGSADSTSWFLVVLAALDDAALSAELEPAWRAAAGWLVRALAAGGGFVRYGPRSAPGGLVQQGWRDAIAPVERHPEGAGIVRPDGTEPAPPLADADCQAAAVAALDALARLDPAGDWPARATALRSRLAGWGAEAMAIEGDDTVVRGAGSQLGWLLWARALEGEAAAAAAERLVQPDVLTDFGLRTLSSSHPAFRPHAYHRGGVWPFDCWLGWGGLRAAGRTAEAERVRTGVLIALDRLGLAPELYAVTTGNELERIAVANRVQAWTVGARWALEHDWSA